MRVSRVFVANSLEKGQTIALDDEAAHYVKTVLRLKQDAEIILFNGQGGEYIGSLDEVSRKSVRVKLHQWRAKDLESPLCIAMGLAISRGDRMDFAVQKAVELGVTELSPILTERCVVQLKADKEETRLKHWQKIAEHAAEQCGRTFVPQLTPVMKLDEWLNKQTGLKLFLDPFAENSLGNLQPEAQRVTLLTGPEGGFAEHERFLAKSAGFIPVKLGLRILRTETVALAALAGIQTLWGDFAPTNNPSS
jgi:16S rRNA (uracil1498-N3)-methyltransferase